MKDILRHVRLGDTGFSLITWAAASRYEGGFERHYIGYEFRDPQDVVIFQGEDYGVGMGSSTDDDASLRGLLGFLTLRPGDTDSEYFRSYTPAQLDFCRTHAEELSMWAMELDDGEPMPFVEVES